MKAVLHVNSKSRKGRAWFSKAKLALEERGFDLSVAVAHKRPKEMIDAIRASVLEKRELIIVGAGDGTLRAAAEMMQGSDSTLGVLPLGTGNAFARDLGIRTEVDDAVDVILHGKTETLDVGLFDGHVFLNVATIGITAEISRNLDPHLKRTLGPLAYVSAVAQAYLNAKPFELTLTVNGETHRCTALQFVLANGRYHAGPFVVNPGAELNNHTLSGYVVEGDNRGVLISAFVGISLQQHGALSHLYSFNATTGSVFVKPLKHVILDGEKFAIEKGEFQLLEKVLKVRVPEEFGSEFMRMRSL